MQHYNYYSATTVDECLGFLSRKKGVTKIIAGGTDLMPALRSEAILPDHILNIMEVGELRRIEETENKIFIGSAVTFQEIIESKLLNKEVPLLCQAASAVGGPQIRNRGTIGGNILTASPCADVLPAVLALQGQLDLSSNKQGSRVLPLDEVVKSAYTVDILPDEILSGIIIEKKPPQTIYGFEKIGRRNALARARMSISIVMQLDDGGRITKIQIVPGAVMPMPKRIKRAEELLLGEMPLGENIDGAADIITAEIIKVTGERESTEYKMPVLKNVVKRVIRRLAEKG